MANNEKRGINKFTKFLGKTKTLMNLEKELSRLGQKEYIL